MTTFSNSLVEHDAQRGRLVEGLLDKAFRDAYVAEHLHQGFAFQVRTTRKARRWKQAQLAKRAEMKQSRISQIEDPSYEGLTLTTAKRIAAALDVALILRLVPYSKFADYLTGYATVSMADWTDPIPAFDDDPGLKASQPAAAYGLEALIGEGVTVVGGQYGWKRLLTPASVVSMSDYTRSATIARAADTASELVSAAGG